MRQSLALDGSELKCLGCKRNPNLLQAELGRHVRNTRSELGTRFDRVLALYTNAVLSLRARVARSTRGGTVASK